MPNGLNQGFPAGPSDLWPSAVPLPVAGLRLFGGVGSAVLSSGAVTVANTAITSASQIYLTVQVPGGTVGSPYVFSLTPGTGFVIHSTSGSDSSTVGYLVVSTS